MRTLTLIAIAVLAASAARIAAPAHSRPGRALTCGIERWRVKTLQDRPHLIPARWTSVSHLVGLTPPRSVPATRLPFERHLYSVIAAVTLVRQEADQDLHLVLQRGSKHMIAEAPNAPFCTANATVYRKRQMASARAKVQLCPRAHVVGVAFWDYFHHQTGVAPNAIELHPILGFDCLTA